MFGVVLWSDQPRNRAVIWCEDHGDLAFYKGEGEQTLDSVDLEPGDLVQFTVRADRNMRLASSPRLVASDEYPTLARDLRQAGNLPVADAGLASASSGGKILTFESKSSRATSLQRQKKRAI